MKTILTEGHRVFLVKTSWGKQIFCNIEQLNGAIAYLDTRVGYFTIYHFWNNKPKKVSKKDMKLFFEGANLTQNFQY